MALLFFGERPGALNRSGIVRGVAGLALSESLSAAKPAGIALILGCLAAVTAADFRQRRQDRV